MCAPLLVRNSQNTFTMPHIPVHLGHCQKFKLPVKSDNLHSHSHTSHFMTQSFTLSSPAKAFPSWLLVLSVYNLAHIPHLFNCLERSLPLCALTKSFSSEHTPFSAAPFNEWYIFSSILWNSGLGVDLATPFNHPPHRSCTVILLGDCTNQLRYPLSSHLSCWLTHSHMTHHDRSWTLQHPLSWPFISFTSPPIAFLLPYHSHLLPTLHAGPFHLQELHHLLFFYHPTTLPGHLLEIMIVPWFQFFIFTDHTTCSLFISHLLLSLHPLPSLDSLAHHYFHFHVKIVTLASLFCCWTELSKP